MSLSRYSKSLSAANKKCTFVIWYCDSSEEFSLSNGNDTHFTHTEGISILTNYLAHILKIKTSLLIIQSTWLKFFFGTLTRFKSSHSHILIYIIYMNIYANIQNDWVCSRTDTIKYYCITRGNVSNKVKWPSSRRQIIANLIKMNLINISSNFWA